MLATTRPLACRRPLTRALTAALLLAAACDDPEELTQVDLEADVEADAGDALAVADDDGGRAGAFAAELAATRRFVERAAIVDHEVCGEVKAPASVDVEVLWGRSAAGVGRLRVDVDEASDAEVAIDVAVVVAGETVDELRGATIVGPEALARADFAGDGARPYAIEAELDLRDALAALDVDHGMLVVVAKLRRGDGTVAAADRPLYLFFERDEAGLELFDEAAGLARGLDRPALSLAAAIPEPGGEPADDAVGEGIFAAAATEPQALDVDVIPYVSVKLCARHSVTYTDAGLAGEDYWTTQTLARRMTGADARVYVSGQQIWSGKLGDGTSGDANGEGCTPYLWMPAGANPAIFYDTDTGSINGNNLKVRVKGGGAPSTMIGFANLQASGTYWGTGTNTSSVYPVYLAIAKAMRAHSGGYGGITYYALTEHDNGSRYDRDSEEIRIAPGDENEKFLVVHEYGHAFGDKVGDGHLVGGDCSKTSADDDCSSGGSHGMTSIEWQSCAVNEGFAHFIAADAFNSHSQASCAFRYWSGGHGPRDVDCEGSNSHVTAWMENMCENETLSGAGVELDWLRQFWDVHTNGGTTNMIPFMAWIRESGGWTATTAYDELDAAAQAVGGDIRTNWNGGKAWNGVDY